MILLRKAADRGHTQTAWLDSWHSFSFGDYQDANQMGFGALRVINQDIVQAGQGFAMHSHHDMEIITYVIHGSVLHRDSTGPHELLLNRGGVQIMSAGTGVRHSEFNASRQETLEFLQIWITPAQKGLPPCYEQRYFQADFSQALLIGAPTGNVLKINQDVNFYTCHLLRGMHIKHTLAVNRRAWVQVIKGSVLLNKVLLEPGDGAAISNETNLFLQAQADTECLLFDLA